MKSENKTVVFNTLKAAGCITLCVLLCKYTSGLFSIVMLALAVSWAISNRTSLSLCCFSLFPMILVMNYLILPKSGLFGTVLRIGPLLMAVALFFSATKRRGNHRLPFGGLVAYLVMALVSSIGGFCFQISLFKIINFSVFLVGMWFGTQNLYYKPKDVLILRYFFLGTAFFVVVASLATLPFPAIAYPVNSIALIRRAGMSVAEANAIMTEKNGMSLFAGIFGHSQMLAPVCSCLFGYVACDLLFVERRSTPIHLFILLALPIMVFLTRSRTGLLSFSVMVAMVVFYTSKKVKLPFVMKKRMKTMIGTGVFLFLTVSIAAQVTTGAFTRWIFKTDDVDQIAMQQQDTLNSVTMTRQGLMKESIREFERNPLLGSGFQVNKDSAQYANGGMLVLSAPIEKGLLPLMVLGEGGIVGSFIFLCFLFSFYGTCAKKKYYITTTLFTVLLATNIGEATFFSPGGIGGTLWVLTVGGGFCLDTVLLIQRNQETMQYRKLG